jgi:CBS-domain-containing membrane protein
MGFLVSFNGQFSSLTRPREVDTSLHQVSPVTESKKVKDFKAELTDVLSQNHPEVDHRIGAYQQSAKKFERERKKFYARDIMSSPVRFLTAETPVSEARLLFDKFAFRHLPIVDEHQQICGMLNQAEANHATAGNCRDVMQTKIIVCEENTSIHEIAIVMLREKINALPIINHRRETTGIITMSDILRHVIETTPFLERA